MIYLCSVSEHYKLISWKIVRVPLEVESLNKRCTVLVLPVLPQLEVSLIHHPHVLTLL